MNEVDRQRDTQMEKWTDTYIDRYIGTQIYGQKCGDKNAKFRYCYIIISNVSDDRFTASYIMIPALSAI
jgi:hypothetical protein